MIAPPPKPSAIEGKGMAGSDTTRGVLVACMTKKFCQWLPTHL